MKTLQVLFVSIFIAFSFKHQPAAAGMHLSESCVIAESCPAKRQSKDKLIVFPWSLSGEAKDQAELQSNVCPGTFWNAESGSVTSHFKASPKSFQNSGQSTPSSTYRSNVSSVKTSAYESKALPSPSHFGSSQKTVGNVTAVDKSTGCDHQNIVALEDDPVVNKSALFLFQKHPTGSTLYRYHKGVLGVVIGSEVDLTKDSCVILVGHGHRGTNGVTKLGGYTPEEIAGIVVSMKIKDGHLQTLRLIGCDLGSDHEFARRLLDKLRVIKVETKLHLQRSQLSISPSGEILTSEGDVWRHKDLSKEVIARLDQEGNLLTKVGQGEKGVVINNYKGRPLYQEVLDWPTHPQMFVPADFRKKYTYIDCLEGLTWSLFFEENEKRRAPEYYPADGLSQYWLNDQKPSQGIPIRHITSILDLVREIRHNAREDESIDMYYVLNNYIYKVQRRTFYSSLVGKYVNPSSLDEIQEFVETFEGQKELYTLAELREGLKGSEFNDFCRQTFQVQKCDKNCGLWGRYFMRAVFSASVKNFRTFSLFLMSVIACEVSRSKGEDDSICMAFVGDDYPMAAEDPWPVHYRRGFYGCTVVNGDEIRKREKILWLDMVVAKENSLYNRSKKLMAVVDHDENTEIGIFGKVKVMNKYVFSSFIEAFRGTVEGKKLARGCMGPPVAEPYE